MHSYFPMEFLRAMQYIRKLLKLRETKLLFRETSRINMLILSRHIREKRENKKRKKRTRKKEKGRKTRMYIYR